MLQTHSGSSFNSHLSPSSGSQMSQSAFTIPTDSTYFSVLDLMDVFFLHCATSPAQELLAFLWMDWLPLLFPTHLDCPTSRIRGQPNLFDWFSLRTYHPSPFHSKLIQYVVDLLLHSPFLQDSHTTTFSLLNFLPHCGYQVSPSKFWLCLSR